MLGHTTSSDASDVEVFQQLIVEQQHPGMEEWLDQYYTRGDVKQILESKDTYGRTMLHIAIQHATLREVEILLRHGANVDAIDSNGDTGLHIATNGNRVDIIQKLLEQGASQTIIGQHGTPIELAQRNNFQEIVSLFQQSSTLPALPSRGNKPALKPRSTPPLPPPPGNSTIPKKIPTRPTYSPPVPSAPKEIRSTDDSELNPGFNAKKTLFMSLGNGQMPALPPMPTLPQNPPIPQKPRPPVPPKRITVQLTPQHYLMNAPTPEPISPPAPTSPRAISPRSPPPLPPEPPVLPPLDSSPQVAHRSMAPYPVFPVASASSLPPVPSPPPTLPRAPPPPPSPAPSMAPAPPSLPTASYPTSQLAEQKLAEQSASHSKTNSNKSRRMAAEEILSTEVTYVEQLRQLIQGYKKPIESSMLLSRNDIKQIFLNAEVLESLHRTFLLDLQTRMRQNEESQSDETHIGDLISTLVPYLKLYVEYISDFDRSLKIVQQFYEENEKFAALVNSLSTGTYVGKMGLESLRVCPIQRVPRYVLLLKALLKYTSEDHVDYKDLDTALNKMSELATFINTKKSEAESRNRLVEISSNLVGKRLADLDEEDDTPSAKKEHQWKKNENKYKQCDVCREMGYCTKCKECGFRIGIGGVHADCMKNAPHNCGQKRGENQKTFIKHSRHLVYEDKELSHKFTSLKHPDSKAVLHRETIVLLLNDSLAVLYPIDTKYEYISLIRWISPAGATILNQNVTDLAFSLTDPRNNELHTFVAASKEHKDKIISDIKTQINSWHAHCNKEKQDQQQQRDQFRGVTFQILFTVPVASSKEKEFTAYVVDMKTQKGAITVMKRYRQFLALHQCLQQHYKSSCLPKFPKKRYLGNNTSHKFIQKRCQKIGRYLNEMMQLPGILDIEEVQKFLTTTISAKGEGEDELIKMEQGDQKKDKQVLDIITPKHGEDSNEEEATHHSPAAAAGGGEFELTNDQQVKAPSQEHQITERVPNETVQTAESETTVVKQAVALYDFVSESDKELDMLANDIVYVHEMKDNESWWFGTVNGRDFGFFPKNYVRLL